MKINNNQIDGYVRNFNVNQRAVLIYGPDHGLVQERGGIILKQILTNPDDPFGLLDLSGDQIKEDPARLFDEISSIQFFGGRKVVRVRDSAEKAAPALAELLKSPPSGLIEELGFVLVLAGELTPKSALRKLFEVSPEVAALPCYHDEGAGVANLVREEFKARGIMAEPEVFAYLSSVLAGDRMLIRQEIEKIDLYCGEERRLTIEMVRECTEDLADSSADEVVQCVADGNRVGLNRALEKAFAQGLQPIMVLRAQSRHIQRLWQVVRQMEQGEPMQQAVTALRPPLFFKHKNAFQQQIGMWRSSAKLRAAIAALYQAELSIKTKGISPELITARALSELAGRARR